VATIPPHFTAKARDAAALNKRVRERGPAEKIHPGAPSDPGLGGDHVQMTYLGFQRALSGCLPAVFAAAFLMPGSASAEQAAAPAETNLWTKSCANDPQDPKVQRCSTGQVLILSSDGSLRVSF
jgi:hypothetical protein